MEFNIFNLAAPTVFLVAINLVFFGQAVETPKYTVVQSESDYEIRLYKDISWMSALVQGTSFQKSTKDGFHGIYQYIHGANLNRSQIPMTAPVLTTITPSQQGTSSMMYGVRLFVSIHYGVAPPQPNPELNLQLDKWRARCVAVRKFSGFAGDDNIGKELEALVSSIKGHSGAVLEDKASYSIAQYNSSSHLSERLNEVWMYVSGVNAEGSFC